jgi:hypothetical protein
MPDAEKLIAVFEEARRLLAAAGNDFGWSSWRDRVEALEEIDQVLSGLRSGAPPDVLTLEVLFAPTGPIQEVSLSSGWGDEFVELAGRFDEAMAGGAPPPAPRDSCECLAGPPRRLTSVRELGPDGRLAEVSLHVCRVCGRHWLRYLYEVEAFKGSGRWYLGAVSPEQASNLTAGEAKSMLESLDWYYYGGSYYDGRTGRTSGTITLNP